MSQAKDARKFNPFAFEFVGVTAANLLWDQGYYDLDGNQILPTNIHNSMGIVSVEWPDGSISQLGG